MRRARALVVGLILVALVPSVALAQSASFDEQLEDAQRSLSEAQELREQTEQELAEARELEGDARAQLVTVTTRLEREEAALAALQDELDAARNYLQLTAAEAQRARDGYDTAVLEVVRVEGELAEQQARLENRIRAAFKYGHVSFAEAFAGVRDVADFLNTTHYVSHVLDNDRTLVQTVERLRAELQENRDEAQRMSEEADRLEVAAAAAADEVERQTRVQEQLAAEVRQTQRVQQVALENLREDRASLEGHLAGLEEEAARIQSQLAEIARRQEEERRRLEEERRRREATEACENARASGDEAAILEACGPPPSDRGPGAWLRPIDGRMSSPFGPRPSLGGFHFGVDLANSLGTPIVSAAGGTVVAVTAGCHPTNSWTCGGGFGNYAVIDHGGGFATVYAHQSVVEVSVGQVVAPGERIGQVGNSGRSYGPHLHFELYDAGSRKDPCGYISC